MNHVLSSHHQFMLSVLCPQFSKKPLQLQHTLINTNSGNQIHTVDILNAKGDIPLPQLDLLWRMNLKFTVQGKLLFPHAYTPPLIDLSTLAAHSDANFTPMHRQWLQRQMLMSEPFLSLHSHLLTRSPLPIKAPTPLKPPSKIISALHSLSAQPATWLEIRRSDPNTPESVSLTLLGEQGRIIHEHGHPLSYHGMSAITQLLGRDFRQYIEQHHLSTSNAEDQAIPVSHPTITFVRLT